MFSEEIRTKQDYFYTSNCLLSILYNNKFIFMAISLGTNDVRFNEGSLYSDLESSCTCAKYQLGFYSLFIHSVVINDSVRGQ